MTTKKDAPKAEPKVVKKAEGKELVNVEHEEKIDQAEAERLERAKQREEAQPKKAKKTKYSFVIDDPEGLLPLITDAWDASKGVGDAPFVECQPAFKVDLLYHAQDVLRTGKASEADSAIAAFERKIHDIRTKQEA